MTEKPSKGTDRPKAGENRAKNRPERRPMFRRNVLTAKSREGYHRHFINDEKGRINAALEAGYTFVPQDENNSDYTSGKPCHQGDAAYEVVNSDGTRAYLMEIPLEYYEEDQKLKESRNRDPEASVKDAISRDPLLSGGLKSEHF